MKKFLFFLALAAGILTVSCNKERFPYEKAQAVTGQQVFFPESIPSKLDISSDATSFEIPVYRGSKDLTALNVPIVASGKGIEDGIFTAPASVSFAANESKTKLVVSFDPDKLGKNNYVPLTFKIGDEKMTTIYGISSLSIQAGVALPWILFDKGTLYESPYWGEEEEKEMYYQQLTPTIRYCKIDDCFGHDTIEDGGEYDVQPYCWYWNTETNEVYVPVQYMGYTNSNGETWFSDQSSFYNLHWPYKHPEDPHYGGSGQVEGTEEWFAFCDKFRTTYPRSGGDWYPYYDGKGTFYLANGYYAGKPGTDAYLGGYTDNTSSDCDWFTGSSFPDYTIEIDYLGLFTDKKGLISACADVNFVGMDIASAKAALAATDDPDEVYALIEAGDESVITINEGGEIRLAMPEEAESGKYTIAVIPFNGKSEAQPGAYVTFKYTAPGAGDNGPKALPSDDELFTTDDIVAVLDEQALAKTWDVYAFPMQNNAWLPNRYYIGSVQFVPDEEGIVKLPGLGGGTRYGYDDALSFEFDEGVLWSLATGLGQFDYNGTTLYVNDEYMTRNGKYYPVDYCLLGAFVADGLIAIVGNPTYLSKYNLDFNALSFELYDTEDREYAEDEAGNSNYWGSLGSFSEIILADPDIYEHPYETSSISAKSMAKSAVKSFKPYTGPALKKERAQLKLKSDVIASGKIYPHRNRLTVKDIPLK